MDAVSCRDAPGPLDWGRRPAYCVEVSLLEALLVRGTTVAVRVFSLSRPVEALVLLDVSCFSCPLSNPVGVSAGH